MLLYVLKNGSREILNETNAPCFGFSLRSILKNITLMPFSLTNFRK